MKQVGEQVMNFMTHVFPKVKPEEHTQEILSVLK